MHGTKCPSLTPIVANTPKQSINNSNFQQKNLKKHTKMEQETKILTGSGTNSDTSTKLEEEAELMQVSVQEERQIKLKVMVGLDESDASFYALNWALNHLLSPKIALGSSSSEGVNDSEEGCFVYLVHVQHPFQNYVSPAGPGLHTAAFTASSVVQSVKQAQAETSARILEQALSYCRSNKVRAETLILEGDPKEEICKATEQTHVDMLVVGSRGLGQIKRAFLGSVSDYCAHHASCPVLIVKPPKDVQLSMSSR